jgi:mycothiol synthase
MTTPQSRAFAGEADVPGMVAMLQAIQALEGGPDVTRDDLEIEWVGDEPGWVKSLQIWEADSVLVAAIGVWHEVGDDENRAYASIDVHPDWQIAPFADEVVTKMVGETAAIVERSVDVRVGMLATSAWKRSAVERAGFVPERVYHRMRTTIAEAIPAAVFPEGFTLRPLAGEDEVDAWVETFAAGFAEHHDAPRQTSDEKLNRMRLPSYRPDLDLVLTDPDGALIGIALGQIEQLESGTQEAWVRSLALRAEWRGKGLGRAMLAEIMRALAAAGHPVIWLTVDSENESGAIGLYERAGFAPEYQMVVYVRLVDPG